MKAVSVFSEDGKSTTTTTYFPSGKKNAEGKYVLLVSYCNMSHFRISIRVAGKGMDDGGREIR